MFCKAVIFFYYVSFTYCFYFIKNMKVIFTIAIKLNSIAIAYRAANELGLSKFLINLFSHSEPSGGYNSFPITHV